MRNRWGLELKRGLPVRVSLARGGHAMGIVHHFERISGYGWRIVLDSGLSASIDDAERDYSEQLEVMALHYCIAAVWADCEEGTNPRISSAAMAIARARCMRFVDAIGPMFGETLARHDAGYGTHPDCGNLHPACAAMGHDLYLTSAGHGVGFWDRSELDEKGLGNRLTEVCDTMGDPNAYFYRGWLYFMGE